MVPITELHTFGWSKEEELHSVIEEALGETCTKTKSRFDTHDFVSESYLIELKCRNKIGKNKKPFLPSSEKTWLVPTCKAKNHTNKTIIFFYYFDSTKELFYCIYDEETFKNVERSIPVWHPEHQEKFWIPSNMWEKIEYEIL